MNSATTTAAVKSAGEARPSRFVKYSFTSESEPELAKSSDEESSGEAEAGRARSSRKETVEVATMVPRERGQQWTAQQLWDVPQIREWLVREFKRHGSLDRLCQEMGARRQEARASF